MRKAPIFPVLTILMAIAILGLYYLSTRLPSDADGPDQGRDYRLVSILDRPQVIFGNPTLGPNGAKVVLVEYGDYLCAPCAEMDLNLAKLVEEYPDDIQLVWKDFPNENLHPGAKTAAAAARCANDQGAFWEYHDLLLANQASGDQSAYVQAAASLGLDSDRFGSCLQDSQTVPLVERDMEEGLRLQIDATPYLFVNERRVRGAVDYSLLKNIVEGQINIVDRAAAEATSADSASGN